MALRPIYYGTTIIGEIPESWKVAKIDTKMVDILGGFSWAKNKAVAVGLPHLRPFNIGDDGEVVVASNTVHIPKDSVENITQFQLLPGDVLYNNTNSRELVGKSAVVRERMEVAFSNHINRLRIRDKNQLLPAWLTLCLRYLQMVGFFETYSNKWIGQAGFSVTELAKVEIPIPCINIQRAIVARIESLLGELREMRELHKAIDRDVGMVMESVLREVFDADAMSNWNKDSFGNLLEINARLVNPTLDVYKNLPHIHGGVMTELTCKLLPYRSAVEDEVMSNKFLFSPTSVLYSKIRPRLRKVVLTDFQGLCSADVYPLEVKSPDTLAPEFLQWLLVSPQFTDYAVSLSIRARIPKINQNQLFSYQCSYPSIEQQKQIAQYILSIRDEVEEMQYIQSANNRLFDQVEQSILEQAFRGEL